MMTMARSRLAPFLAGLTLSLAALGAEPGSDWPNLFGPTHDSVCVETGLSLDWKPPLPIVWSVTLGEGYSAPSIVGDAAVVFHRDGDKEVVQRRSAATGEVVWSFVYPTAYVDRYGYNNGPRCAPIIAAGKVYTLGAEGKLHAIDLETGAKRWGRDLNADFHVEQGFFGVGATPLLERDRLIINVGGKTVGAGIVAIEAGTGKTLWQATDQGASYATPRAATIHGQRHVFVFTEAGLVDLNPADGKVRWSIPFRSRLYESVNATSPVVEGDIVLVSATYRTGSLCVRIKPDGGYEQLWRGIEPLDSHFSNMVVVGQDVYAFSGRHEQGSDLRCLDLLTGKVKWRRESALGRGSLVRVGDKLLAWGERGHLATIKTDPDRFTLVSAAPEPLLRYPCWTPPVISRGRLYLRNETTLLCLDLRQK